MRIDVHTHLWEPAKTQDHQKTYASNRGMSFEEKLNVNKLLEAMDEAGVHYAFLATAQNAFIQSFQEGNDFNEYILKQVKVSGGRLKPYCTIDTTDIPKACEYLKKRLEEDGFIGFKFHPNVFQMYPDDERLFPLYTIVQSLNLPVLFHTGGIGYPPVRDNYGNPLCIDNVATEFPNLKIIMGHGGRGFYKEAGMMLRKHKNVYVDISANCGKLPGKEHLLIGQMIKEIKLWAGNSNKILFGSDYPYYGLLQTKTMLEKNLDVDGEIPITEEDINNILNENAIAFVEKTNIKLD